MKISTGVMVPLGYGKYFRSDYIVGLVPIEENRGPGRRTKVFIQGQQESFIASRSEGAIIRNMSESSDVVMRTQEQYYLLADIQDTIEGIDPMLRSIIREQGHWDLDRLEERIRELLSDDDL